MSEIPRFKRKFEDVRHPSRAEREEELASAPRIAEIMRPSRALAAGRAANSKMKHMLTRGALIAGVAIVAVLVVAGMRLRDISGHISLSMSAGLAGFESAVADLKALRFGPAQEKASDSTDEIRRISEKLKPLDAILAGNFGNLLPVLRDLGESYRNFQDLSLAAFSLVERAKKMERLAPEILRGRSGDELIAELEGVERDLAKVSDATGNLVGQSSRLKGILPIDSGDYLSLQVDLARARNFLGALVPWLKSPDEHRIALFLENPSELRPGGGFVGSYAEVTVKGGAIARIDVRDVSYADRELDLKTVPPKPLQALVRNWRAADANWFFDYSESARKTLGLLEASQVYKKEGVKFDGAVTVSAKVIRDLLALTGPLALPDGRTITDEDFLAEIQREVQAGHDVGSLRAKQILEDLAPLLIEKVASLSSEERKPLAESFQGWIEKKDLMVYFKDPLFQRFFDGYQATGRVMALPAAWSGDYLAVVNANIGGGKTDVVMRQKVILQSQISMDGTVNDHLVIRRTHTGGAGDPWWYRETNQNYVQVFTPSDSQLEFSEGGFAKRIASPLNYAAQGYLTDPDVAAIESTALEHLASPMVTSFRQAGKNVFATWTRTPAGGTTELSFDYSRKLPNLPEEGRTFELVFEKQASAEGEYEFEITAPAGFRFKENGLPVFEYKTADPPGRLTFQLTLERF